jgi:hypothetical protein
MEPLFLMKIKTLRRFFWPGLILSVLFLTSPLSIASEYSASHLSRRNTSRDHLREAAGGRIAALHAENDESTETIYPSGQWEGETSLTAEDIRKLKNWPDTLLEWLGKAWEAFARWFKALFGHESD